MEWVALLERVLEPNGATVHDLLLELDTHMDLIDAHLSEDAPAVRRLALAAIALVVEQELWLPAVLLLLLLLCLLLQSLRIPVRLLA